MSNLNKKYKVTKAFVDLNDNLYQYKAGEVYPREGIEVDEDRAKELATVENLSGQVLIEVIKSARRPATPEDKKQKRQTR